MIISNWHLLYDIITLTLYDHVCKTVVDLIPWELLWSVCLSLRLFESSSTTSTPRSSTASWRSSSTCCTSGSRRCPLLSESGLCLFMTAELVMLFLPSGICWWILETGAWWSWSPSSVPHTSERRSPESSLSTSRWSHAASVSKIKRPLILMAALLCQIKRSRSLLYDHSYPMQFHSKKK